MKAAITHPRRRSLFPASLLALALVCELGAATYYVAPDGNDTNPGTSLAPFATVNKGAAIAQAGDTVIIRPGTYQPTSRVTVANSGTATAPITFRAEVHGQAIIDGRNQVPNMPVDGRVGLFEMINKSWIVVDGLRVINAGFWGIWASVCQNVTIQNCSTYNSYGSGILATGVGSYNIKIYNNVVQRACMYPSTSVGTNECITLASVDTFEVAGNVVFDRLTDPSNGGEGIDAKNACKNGKIYFNTVYDLHRVGIYVDAFSVALSNVEVYSNLVYRCGSGIRVAVESGGSMNGVSVHDNVVRDVRAEGIGVRGYLNQGPMQNVYVYQNTIVRSGNPNGTYENVSIVMDSANGQDANHVVRNNIIYQNLSTGPYIRTKNQTFLTIDRNLFFGPASSGPIGTNAIHADPLFVDYAGNDFHLTSASPAIDAVLGSPLSTADYDSVARPAGAAGDLGAFEYSGTLAPPPAPGGLAASAASATQINLSWSASNGATRYVVKRSATTGGPYAAIAVSVTTTSYADSSVSPATTYFYVVSAANAAGDSGDSAETSATTPAAVPPAAPTGFAAVAGNNQVSLTWNTSAGATSYTIKRATVSGGPYASLSTTSATTLIDSTAANGTTYYYVVSASNSYGESADSAQLTATPQAPALNSPTNLVASSGRGKIGLTWTQSTSPSIKTNRIYRSATSGGPYTLLATLTAKTSYNNSVPSGTTYHYVVTALNSSGVESGFSNQASATAR